jgi:quinol monooxygenase YgiN
MIVVTGRVQIAAEQGESFTALATEMCQRSREEDGCGGYRVYADLEQPDRYVFVEEWADEDALQRHFREQHTGVFMKGLRDVLAGPADAVFHTTSVSRRLDPARGLVPVE